MRTVSGKYRLGRQIGEGGMGTVYEAEHVGLGTRIAIKLLGETLSENPTFVKRFRREARAAAAVRHENVVSVTDTGTDETGVPYIVMELLEGESLAATLRRELILIPQAAAEVTAQMLLGLESAHTHGVIHRDLKPGNIFLARQNDGTYRVKILDFGISKFIEDASNASVTVQGAIVGTPNFMAPEQVTGEKRIDSRVDLYAVGIMLYRMVTGKLPYAGGSTKEVYQAIVDGEPLQPREIRPDVPEDLERVILKAMALDPEDRFQNAVEFLDALRAAVPSLELETSYSHLPFIPEQGNAAIARAQRGGNAGVMQAVFGSPSVGTIAKWALMLGALSAIVWALFDDSESRPASSQTFRYGVRQYASREIVIRDHDPVAKYLSERLDRRVEVILNENYDQLFAQLAGAKLELAVLPPYAYVRATASVPRPRIIAVASNPGGAHYVGHIIARADSDIKKISDLKGKSFCYVDKDATTGYLYARHVLRKYGLNPDRDLGSFTYTGDHITSLRKVYNKECDAAAVYQGILLQAGQHNMKGFRSLAITSEVPPPAAYCVPFDTPEDQVRSIREALLALKPGRPENAKWLYPNTALRGFEAGDDSLYDPVRKLAAIEANKR